MKHLRAFREAVGLTQMEVAVLVGIEPSALSRYERGAVSPSIEMAGKIARALGVTIDELINGPAPEEWELVIRLGETRKDVIDMSMTMGHLAQISCTRDGAALLLTGKTETFRDDEKFEGFLAQLKAARGLILRNIEEMGSTVSDVMEP